MAHSGRSRGRSGAGEGGDGGGQGPVVTGWVERDPIEVPGQLEVGILHPYRMAEPEGNGHDPAAEGGSRARSWPRTSVSVAKENPSVMAETSDTATLMVCMCAVGVSE